MKVCCMLSCLCTCDIQVFTQALAFELKLSVATVNPKNMISCMQVPLISSGHMSSIGAIRFENRFCASTKCGIGGGGWVSAQGAVYMAAALADCSQKSLGRHWLGHFSPFQHKWAQKRLLCFCRGSIHFWHCRQLSVRRSIHWLESPVHCKLANEWVQQRS